MGSIKTKTKLVFLPVFFLAVIFCIAYALLYWCLYIQLGIPLKEDIVQLWIPIGLSLLCIILFIRPRVHILKLDKDNGRIRTLYYLLSAAVLCIPTIIGTQYLDTATGKLTILNSIKEISQKPSTKFYKVDSYVLNKHKIGVESAMTYSGKYNKYLDFNIYVAIPFTADVYDMVQSPPAFLSVIFHDQISSKISDSQRRRKWKSFWEANFENFDTTAIDFIYLERIGNNEDRDNLAIAVNKSELYKQGKPVIILKPINEPFSERNGNKMNYIFLSFGVGLLFGLL